VKLTGANLQGWDLSGNNLLAADLSSANLSGTDLQEAELGQANLSGANLSGAHLDYTKLFKADLTAADLTAASLTSANLQEANLSRADLRRANLSGAKLREADLSGANLNVANLSGAVDLTGASLSGANLSGADLSGANLSGAHLNRAVLIGVNLKNTTITGCRVFGIAAWDVDLEGAQQDQLVVTRGGESTITVDSLEIAQFIYLLLNNKKIRDVIDTITSKVVLILGRFSPERKAVLDAIREELRKRNYLPVLFDFDKPTSRDLTETISTLAHISRFIIADITDPRSIPQELTVIVPDLPSVPVQPLLLTSDKGWAMFEHFRRYPWVLDPFIYNDPQMLLASLSTIIGQIEIKVAQLAPPAAG
jgi:uncharacterized protein YjbI with pentapeptide repeats